MFTLFVRLLILLLILCLLTVGLVRAFSFDADYFDELRAALNESPGCESVVENCYLGIIPGSTPADNSMVLVAEHPWVGEVISIRGFPNLSSEPARVPELRWLWSPERPRVLLGPARMTASPRSFIIETITMPTVASWAELWLAFGPPLRADVFGGRHILAYPGFELRVPARCQLYWDAPAEISITYHEGRGSIDAAQYLWQSACEDERGRQGGRRGV